jgi:hypothetical protein
VDGPAFWQIELAKMDQCYDALEHAWRDSGLATRRVIATPKHEMAVEAVRQYCDAAGWKESLWGPVSSDTWWQWLHILSHQMHIQYFPGGGHSLVHGKIERELLGLVVAKLSAPLVLDAKA